MITFLRVTFPVTEKRSGYIESLKGVLVVEVYNTFDTINA